MAYDVHAVTDAPEPTAAEAYPAGPLVDEL
jgi:hypothetical protein